LHTAYKGQNLGNIDDIEDDGVKQEGDTFGPETIGGKEAAGDSQCQYGKPGQAIDGPQTLDKRPDKGKQEKEEYQRFQNNKFNHGLIQFTTLQI
jgi:hypothetical protein